MKTYYAQESRREEGIVEKSEMPLGTVGDIIYKHKM